MSKKAAPKKGAARQSKEAAKAAPEATKDKHPGGRPTKYDPKFVEQAFKLCLLGATDVEIADFLQIAESTLNLWKGEHPEFSESLTRGKGQADAEVAHSLYRRALGYSHDAVKILQDKGQPLIVPYVEHYPPDTPAATLWLKNRQPARWRDKVETEHSTKPGDPIANLMAAIAEGARLRPPGAA